MPRAMIPLTTVPHYK